MSITKIKYGEKDGSEVFAYTLDNGRDLSATVISYGATLTKLVYKGVDVVTGWDSLEGYVSNAGYYGATVGRNSNRIANSAFELGGKTYTLFANNGKNNLHGGKNGFNSKIWEAKCNDGDEPSVSFSYISPDGEEGFPGEAHITVTYTLTAENGLQIHYTGVSDADTVINMTNHSYFNLNGHGNGTIENHRLWIASRFYTPNMPNCVPDGSILPVDGTPFDFTKDTTIGANLAIDHPQTKLFGTIDHNFALEGRGFRLAATAEGDKSGIVMEMYTDLPGVQIYIPPRGNDSKMIKDGESYPAFNAFCLETQMFPNNLNYSHFQSSIVLKGEKYDTTTEFRFR